VLHLVRSVLVLAALLAALLIVVVVVKLAFALATLAVLALVGVWALNFARSLVRRLEARRLAGGPGVMTILPR
jgi:hypothetical protein